jgi:hypothetical protein
MEKAMMSVFQCQILIYYPNTTLVIIRVFDIIAANIETIPILKEKQ